MGTSLDSGHFAHCNVDTDVIVWEGDKEGATFFWSVRHRFLSDAFRRSYPQTTRIVPHYREFLLGQSQIRNFCKSPQARMAQRRQRGCRYCASQRRRRIRRIRVRSVAFLFWFWQRHSGIDCSKSSRSAYFLDNSIINYAQTGADCLRTQKLTTCDLVLHRISVTHRVTQAIAAAASGGVAIGLRTRPPSKVAVSKLKHRHGSNRTI